MKKNKQGETKMNKALKEKLRKAILEHEEWIKTVPERIKHKEERIDAIKKAINLVSVDKFDWKDYRIKEQLDGTIKVRSIDIENKIKEFAHKYNV